MKWDEFQSLLVGISPDTALGRVVSIRSETNREHLKHFSKEQRRIRNEWLSRRAKKVTPASRDAFLEDIKNAFIAMAKK